MHAASEKSVNHAPQRKQREQNNLISPLFFSAENNGTLQRKACACGGSCPRCIANKNTLQTKLAVSQPSDPYEREADRIADEIVELNQQHTNVEQNQIDNAKVRRLQKQSITHDMPTHKPIAQDESGAQDHEEINDGDAEIPDLLYDPLSLSGMGEVQPLGGATKISSIAVDQVKQEMIITFSDGTTKKHNISTGKGVCGTPDDPCKNQDNLNCTPNGTFTFTQRGKADTKNSYGDAMAWFVGFDVGIAGRSGLGIHNSQPVPGTPASHGCVRTGTAAQDVGVAEIINKGITVGTTKITISGKAATKSYACPPAKKK